MYYDRKCSYNRCPAVTLSSLQLHTKSCSYKSNPQLQADSAVTAEGRASHTSHSTEDRRPALNSYWDGICNCKAQHVSAFLSVTAGGKEGTRLRREAKNVSVTSNLDFGQICTQK
jgi:hypothetical protein